MSYAGATDSRLVYSILIDYSVILDSILDILI